MIDHLVELDWKSAVESGDDVAHRITDQNYVDTRCINHARKQNIISRDNNELLAVAFFSRDFAKGNSLRRLRHGAHLAILPAHVSRNRDLEARDAERSKHHRRILFPRSSRYRDPKCADPTSRLA